MLQLQVPQQLALILFPKELKASYQNHLQKARKSKKVVAKTAFLVANLKEVTHRDQRSLKPKKKSIGN